MTASWAGYLFEVGDKSGLWGLLASACAVTGLVVVAGFLASPTDERAELSASTGRPSPGRTTPTSDIVTLNPTAAPVTIKARPKPRISAAEKRRRRAAHRLAVLAEQRPVSVDFTISSFNALGSSHTKSGGTHSRFGTGPSRARQAAQIVADHGIDVVGFQEMQADQLSAFNGATGGAFDAYPGFELGRLNTENSILWRTDQWQLVEKRPISIPYFRGHLRTMPLVKLRNTSTGLEAWFFNTHNPATTPQWGDNEHWRDVATGIEIDLVNRLRRDTHLPVFVTGDMNEREEFFCRFTANTDLEAAMGGTGDGGCRPARIRYVDWILGSSGVTFSGYLEDTSALVQRTTDHPVIVSQAHFEGKAPAPAGR